MPHSISNPWRAAVLVVTVVVALGCPTVAGAGGRSADEQIAEESVLTIDDVPSGFEPTEVDDSSEPYPGRECRAIREGRKLLNQAPNAEVEFRTQPGPQGGALINNKVAVFKNKKAARAAVASYSTKSTGDCFESTYREIFRNQPDDPEATVDISTSRYLPDLGDTAIGFEIEIAVSSAGESQTFYVDVELVRVGRGVDAFAFFNSGSQPPSDDVVAMTEAGVTRLEAVL